MKTSDPDFVKYLESLKALPANQKAKLREHLLAEAGMGSRAHANPQYVHGSPKGLKEPGNIDLNQRPVVSNDDGSKSTELSTSFGTDKGEVLVPTVANGRFLSVNGKKPAPGSMEETDMFNRARAHYEATGEHMGIFDTPENADAYAEAVHNRGQEAPPPPPAAVTDALGGK